jgi:hypothetical protein
MYQNLKTQLVLIAHGTSHFGQFTTVKLSRTHASPQLFHRVLLPLLPDCPLQVALDQGMAFRLRFVPQQFAHLSYFLHIPNIFRFQLCEGLLKPRIEVLPDDLELFLRQLMSDIIPLDFMQISGQLEIFIEHLKWTGSLIFVEKHYFEWLYQVDLRAHLRV